MDTVFVPLIISIGTLAGSILGFNYAMDNVESNVVQGYHCGKITKHTGIKSAKAQVLAYQTMTRG